MWSKILFEFARLPTVFVDFCPADKKNKTYRYPCLWQKRLKITIVRLWNVVSAREFDWQFLTKGLKSSPINRIQKKWRQYVAARTTIGSNLFCIIILIFTLPWFYSKGRIHAKQRPLERRMYWVFHKTEIKIWAMAEIWAAHIVLPNYSISFLDS